MGYIGRGLDKIANVEKLDNITFDGGTTYALTKSSSAFTPNSANSLLVSIDGVIQQGNFSVSTTNIVFDWSPTSANTCNFIMHYGVGVINIPADGTITAAKIVDNAIDSEHYTDGSIDAVHLSANSVDSDSYVDGSIDNAHLADDAVGVAELSATGTASSSTFLRGDNSWATAGGTNTPSFMARNTSNQDITHGSDTKVVVDSEFFDTDGCFNNTGSTVTLNGISVPSYSFAPNVSGKYFFSFTGSFSDDTATSSNLAYFVMRISVNDVWKTRNVFNLNNNQGRQGTGTVTLLTDLDGVDDYVNFQAEVGTTDGSTARIIGDYVRVNGFKLL